MQKNTLILMNYAAKGEIEKLDSFANLSYNYSKSGEGVIDVLNNGNTIQSSDNTYSAWTHNSSNNVSYAGQSAGDHETIQLRSNNSNSGVVVTAKQNNNLSATKIFIKWNTNTSIGRTISIYGNNSAYTAPSDLYGDNKGTLLGELTYDGEVGVQELVAENEYEYIGIR